MGKKGGPNSGTSPGEDICAILAAALSELRIVKATTLTAHIVVPDRCSYRVPEDVDGFSRDRTAKHRVTQVLFVVAAIRLPTINQLKQ